MDELGFRGFLARVYDRSADDNVFFLASGLTFSVLLATIPFLLLLVSVPTLVLGKEMELFREEAVSWLWSIVPVTTPEVRTDMGEQLQTVVDSAGSIGLVGAVLFAWFSTRLFGALRTALGEVFDIEDTRGVVRGKLTDLQLVLASTVLLSLNIGLSTVLGIRGGMWLEELGIAGTFVRGAAAQLVSFAAVYLMFLLIYKFVPARRLRWRTAAAAALVAALGFELLKAGFSWYLANFAGYSAIFFTFTTIVVLVIATYYAAVLFLLGGEVAQAWNIHRLIRRQRENF